MITKLIRWKLSQEDIDRLSKSLRPMRTRDEVANLMHCSPSLVAQLEMSALKKIIRALAALEPETPGEDASPA